MTDSDYQPGDAPVPVGTKIQYNGSHRAGQYEVVEHQAPREGTPDPEQNYPDGVAYAIWPVGVAKKFGNRDRSVVQVRRRSFTVLGKGEA